MTTQENVVILGAGFSKSVDDVMPTADELGTEVLRHAREQAPYLFQSDLVFDRKQPFELWLSAIADSLPFKSRREQIEDQARYEQIVNSLVEILGKRQEDVISKSIPTCINRILSVFHEKNSRIVSLNYDTLVESIAENYIWYGNPVIPGQQATVQFHHPDSPQDVYEEERPGGMKLLKLHGSLNWWRSSDDWLGVTLQSAQIGRFGDPTPKSRLSLGTTGSRGVVQPLIVPPLSTKSAYYGLPLLKALWSSAFDAMCEATSLTVVGYSFPIFDYVFSNMVSRAFEKRREPLSDIVVVDPSCGEVSDRLRDLAINVNPGEFAGTSDRKITQYTSVEAFSEKLFRSHIRSVHDEVASSDDVGDKGVFVGIHQYRDRKPDRTSLRAAGSVQIERDRAVIRKSESGSLESAMKMSDLQEAARITKEMYWREDGQSDRAIIGVRSLDRDFGWPSVDGAVLAAAPSE